MLPFPNELIHKILTDYTTSSSSRTLFSPNKCSQSVMGDLCTSFMLNKELTKWYLYKRYYKHLQGYTVNELDPCLLFTHSSFYPYLQWIEEVTITSADCIDIVPFDLLVNCRKLNLIQSDLEDMGYSIDESIDDFNELLCYMYDTLPFIKELTVQIGLFYDPSILLLLSEWSDSLDSLALCIPQLPTILYCSIQCPCELTLQEERSTITQNSLRMIYNFIPQLTDFIYQSICTCHCPSLDFSVFPMLESIDYPFILNCPTELQYVSCRQIYSNLNDLKIKRWMLYCSSINTKEVACIVEYMRRNCERYVVVIKQDNLNVFFGKGNGIVLAESMHMTSNGETLELYFEDCYDSVNEYIGTLELISLFGKPFYQFAQKLVCSYTR